MAISTAVDASAVARVIGIKTTYKNLRPGGASILPQRVAVIGLGSSDSTYTLNKTQVTSADQAGALFGFGSQLHLATLQLLPVNGNGVGTIPVTLYPLKTEPTAVAAKGEISVVGTQTESGTYRVSVNGQTTPPFVIASGSTVAEAIEAIKNAVNGTMGLPVSAVEDADKVNLTVKWAGESSNDVKVAVIGPSLGMTFAVTQPTGGLLDPSLDPALEQMGGVWETLVVNCMSIANKDALDALKDAGMDRWGPQVRKPFVAVTGTRESDKDALKTLTDTRKSDLVNVILPAPDSASLPLSIAAAAVSEIAVMANENPASDYGSLELQNIYAGADGKQWQYIDRDFSVKAGISTTEVKDGVVSLSDTVTMYHPDGELIPAYRYVCDIVKLQNVIFNIDLIFATKEWDGAPLIPDDQATVNPRAKKPSMALAAISQMADNLGLEAIISDPEYTKTGMRSEISADNPKRLDTIVPIKLSGNTNILSIDLEFGFFFGARQIVG